MNSNFTRKSKYLLLKILQEPGGFSFFPSSFFWDKNINHNNIKNSYKSLFSSSFSNISDINNKINIYIHIPFCSKICAYCNCFKRQLINNDEIDIYLSYLDKEFSLLYDLNDNKKLNTNTIFIGGGTPNILSILQFTKLYSIITKYCNLKLLEQFLLDGHPNYYDKEKICYLKSIGVNRLTFAVQTFNNNILKANNRDIYDKKIFEENITYLKKIGIESNIDLLIGLKGQTFNFIKQDIDYLKALKVDNVSVHYLMNSNNINYKLDDNYLDIIHKTKQYLLHNKLPNFSSNKGEDYYASKRNTTISIGAYSITNIYSEIVYSKPGISNYYKLLDLGEIPYHKGMIISKKYEMIRYIYLNILYGVNIGLFKELFSQDMFRIFINEFKYLNINKIIYIKDNILYSFKRDLETLIHFNIFFLEKFSNFSLNNYNNEKLNDFFLESGELIDK